jgi:hypothetical protein
MFKQFSDYVKNKIAYNKALKHPIYSKVMMVSQATIKEAGLDVLVKRGSPNLIARANDLHNYIISVIESKDPVSTLRNIYCQNTLALAKFIVMLPKNKQTEMKNQPGITGELYKYLVKIAKLDKGVKEDLYGTPQVPENLNDEYMKNWVSGKYILLFWFYKTLDSLRRAIGDSNKNTKNDWGLPCLHSACLTAEFSLRESIGLKPNVDRLVSVAYSTFILTFVLNGEKYPDLAFREAYADMIKNKSLILPKF